MIRTSNGESRKPNNKPWVC
ncbi:hypothetical protein ACHAXN_000817 [Cyclotella atomus]